MTQSNDPSQESEKKPASFNRRQFLVSSLGLGVAAVAGSALGKDVFGEVKPVLAADNSSPEGQPMDIETHDNMPVNISKDFKRFDQKNTVFSRAAAGDPLVAPHYGDFGAKTTGKIPPSDEAGWTQKEWALNSAGWGINDYVAPGSSGGRRNVGVYSWTAFQPYPKKWEFKDAKEATDTLKQAATFLGADLVGIAEYDERWVYEKFFDSRTKESSQEDFPFKVTHVIAMAFAMNYEAFRTAPSLIESAAAGVGYSRMAETGHKVATFIRQLGYNAIATGNDTALSVPIAIQAGLGEIGRNGLLITPKYGPRVRLSKIFTDMPLVADKPITFGVRKFCETCKKCALQCPSKAITTDDKPTMSGPSLSNCNGVEKWYVDAEKCIEMWGKNGGDCGSCIASCPYNKLPVWNHKLAELATKTPARPVLKNFDDWFGYGKTYNKKEIEGFWKKA